MWSLVHQGMLHYGVGVLALQPSVPGDMGCSLSPGNDRSTLAAQGKTRHWRISPGRPGRVGRRGSGKQTCIPHKGMQVVS